MQLQNEIEQIPVPAQPAGTSQINSLQSHQDQKQNEDQPNADRSTLYYNNNFQFILSLIGMAVGYGSFWIFPYMIYENGGGVFLIPYTIIMIFIGIPLLYQESSLGQMFQCSIPIAFGRVNKGFKWIAIVFLIMAFETAGFYNIILAYSYRFLFSAFQSPIPYASQSILENKYFTQQILGKADSINQFGVVSWDLFALYVASLIICYIAIRQGVKVSGKVTIFTALLPYVFFIILGIRAITLQGSWNGLVYLFSPKWEKLLTTRIWIDASKQAFFQLGIGIGGVWNFCSLRQKNSSLLLSTYILPLSVFICGMLCALNIYMYLGHFCYQQGIIRIFSLKNKMLLFISFDFIRLEISQLELQGIELSFNVFPKALTILPYSNVWVFLFFISMVLLGIDTQFAFLETIFYYMIDEYGKRGYIFKIKKFKVTLKMFQIGSIIFLCLTFGIALTSSAGIYYVQYMDKFIVTIPVAINLFIQIYLFVWVFPLQEVERQIKKSLEADSTIQHQKQQDIKNLESKQTQSQLKHIQMQQQSQAQKNRQKDQNQKQKNSRKKVQNQGYNNQKDQQIDNIVTPKFIYYSLKIPLLLLIVFANMLITMISTYVNIQQYNQIFFSLGWIGLLAPYFGSLILGFFTLQRNSRKKFTEIQQMKKDQFH